MKLNYINKISNIKEDIILTQEIRQDIKSILTDYVNMYFLREEYVVNLLKLVFEIIEKNLKIIRKTYKLKYEDTFIFYKGGNLLRKIYLNYIYDFNGVISDDIYNKYKDFFKQSDNDFQIIINPNLKKYNEIKQHINDATYDGLKEISSQILKNPKKYFYFETLNNDEKKNIYNKIRDDINNKYGLKITNLFLYDVKDKYLKFTDDKKDIILYEIDTNEKTKYLQTSYNTALEFQKNDEYISFDLIRTKINFKFIRFNDESFNVGGELIDISITKLDDMILQKLNNNEYYNYIDDNFYINKDNFNTMNIKYLIKDLTRVIFGIEETNNIIDVWEDPKYMKRINRLFLLLFFYSIENKNIRDNTFIKNLIVDFQKMKLLKENNNIMINYVLFYVLRQINKKSNSKKIQEFINIINSNCMFIINLLITIIETNNKYIMQNNKIYNIY